VLPHSLAAPRGIDFVSHHFLCIVGLAISSRQPQLGVYSGWSCPGSAGNYLITFPSKQKADSTPRDFNDSGEWRSFAFETFSRDFPRRVDAGSRLNFERNSGCCAFTVWLNRSDRGARFEFSIGVFLYPQPIMPAHLPICDRQPKSCGTSF